MGPCYGPAMDTDEHPAAVLPMPKPEGFPQEQPLERILSGGLSDDPTASGLPVENGPAPVRYDRE